MNQEQAHLFISYASEDSVLASWLARKLAARGHPVWFDQMKLLGGEPWPQTIDDAIKHRSFRVLGLISKHSLRKSKPTGERTLALRIGEQRKISDFMIPLRIDSSELDWVTTPISYIPFTSGWADGWRALLAKLDKICAPRSLSNAALLAASSFPKGDDLINKTGETLYTNVLQIRSFPQKLRVYRISDGFDEEEWKRLKAGWAFYEIAREALVALVPPPKEFSGKITPTSEQLLWAECELFRNVKARNIAANLIIEALSRRLKIAGCLPHPNEKLAGTFYVPASFTENGKLSFNGFRGKKTWLLIQGKVTFHRGSDREVNYHNFAFRLRLARGLNGPFYVQLTPTLVFFDANGAPIVDKSVGSRRRRMTKMWFNDKWLTRLMAAEQLLSNLPTAGEDDLVLEPGLLQLSSPVGIREEIFDSDGDGIQGTEEAVEFILDEREDFQSNE